jgi:hypothetical protein
MFVPSAEWLLAGREAPPYRSAPFTLPQVRAAV